MDIPGLGGFRCVEKGVIFLGPLFSKNIGLGFWMGFDIWLRLGKNAMKRNWGKRVAVPFGYETLGSGMRWAGGQGQN